jgi:hypothetical protein
VAHLVSVIAHVFYSGLDAVGDLLAPVDDSVAVVRLSAQNFVQDGVDDLLDGARTKLLGEFFTENVVKYVYYVFKKLFS